MPIITPPPLFKRAATPSQPDSSVSPTYIAGFVVAGVAVLGIAIWLGFRLYRKRLAKSRRDNLGAAFLSVRGLVKEHDPQTEKNVIPRQNPTSPASFSRDNINSQIILPSRVHLRDSPEREKAEREATIEHHRQSGNFPKPFTFALRRPISPSASLNAGIPERISMVRNSYAPSSRMSRFSVLSAASSYNDSLMSTASPGGTSRSIRKVRQAFGPVLPDELFIALGEQLMILQSFDDGWCVVGRESGLLMPQPKSLFGGSSRNSGNVTPVPMFGSGAGVGTSSGGNVELGMVPAWCFLKAVKGLKAERPVRSTSLGVTVQMDANQNRDNLISWSNF